MPVFNSNFIVVYRVFICTYCINERVFLFLFFQISCSLNVLLIVFSCSLQKVTIFLFFFLINFLLCSTHIMCFVVLISRVFNVPIFNYCISYPLLKSFKFSSFFFNLFNFLYNFKSSISHLLLLHYRSISLLLQDVFDGHSQLTYRIKI